MKKVYIVCNNEDRYTHIKKCFDTKEKAEAFINALYAWKNQLKAETGLDYDDWYVDDWLTNGEPMCDEMQDWLYSHNIDDEANYYILEKKLE